MDRCQTSIFDCFRSMCVFISNAMNKKIEKFNFTKDVATVCPREESIQYGSFLCQQLVLLTNRSDFFIIVECQIIFSAQLSGIFFKRFLSSAAPKLKKYLKKKPLLTFGIERVFNKIENKSKRYGLGSNIGSSSGLNFYQKILSVTLSSPELDLLTLTR